MNVFGEVNEGFAPFVKEQEITTFDGKQQKKLTVSVIETYDNLRLESAIKFFTSLTRGNLSESYYENTYNKIMNCMLHSMQRNKVEIEAFLAHITVLYLYKTRLYKQKKSEAYKLMLQICHNRGKKHYLNALFIANKEIFLKMCLWLGKDKAEALQICEIFESFILKASANLKIGFCHCSALPAKLLHNSSYAESTKAMLAKKSRADAFSRQKQELAVARIAQMKPKSSSVQTLKVEDLTFKEVDFINQNLCSHCHNFRISKPKVLALTNSSERNDSVVSTIKPQSASSVTITEIFDQSTDTDDLNKFEEEQVLLKEEKSSFESNSTRSETEHHVDKVDEKNENTDKKEHHIDEEQTKESNEQNRESHNNSKKVTAEINETKEEKLDNVLKINDKTLETTEHVAHDLVTTHHQDPHVVSNVVDKLDETHIVETKKNDEKVNPSELTVTETVNFFSNENNKENLADDSQSDHNTLAEINESRSDQNHNQSQNDNVNVPISNSFNNTVEEVNDFSNEAEIHISKKVDTIDVKTEQATVENSVSPQTIEETIIHSQDNETSHKKEIKKTDVEEKTEEALKKQKIVVQQKEEETVAPQKTIKKPTHEFVDEEKVVIKRKHNAENDEHLEATTSKKRVVNHQEQEDATVVQKIKKTTNVTEDEINQKSFKQNKTSSFAEPIEAAQKKVAKTVEAKEEPLQTVIKKQIDVKEDEINVSSSSQKKQKVVDIQEEKQPLQLERKTKVISHVPEPEETKAEKIIIEEEKQEHKEIIKKEDNPHPQTITVIKNEKAEEEKTKEEQNQKIEHTKIEISTPKTKIETIKENIKEKEVKQDEKVYNTKKEDKNMEVEILKPGILIEDGLKTVVSKTEVKKFVVDGKEVSEEDYNRLKAEALKSSNTQVEERRIQKVTETKSMVPIIVNQPKTVVTTTKTVTTEESSSEGTPITIHSGASSSSSSFSSSSSSSSSSSKQVTSKTSSSSQQTTEEKKAIIPPAPALPASFNKQSTTTVSTTVKENKSRPAPILKKPPVEAPKAPVVTKTESSKVVSTAVSTPVVVSKTSTSESSKTTTSASSGSASSSSSESTAKSSGTSSQATITSKTVDLKTLESLKNSKRFVFMKEKAVKTTDGAFIFVPAEVNSKKTMFMEFIVIQQWLSQLVALGTAEKQIAFLEQKKNEWKNLLGAQKNPWFMLSKTFSLIFEQVKDVKTITLLITFLCTSVLTGTQTVSFSHNFVEKLCWLFAQNSWDLSFLREILVSFKEKKETIDMFMEFVTIYRTVITSSSLTLENINKLNAILVKLAGNKGRFIGFKSQTFMFINVLMFHLINVFHYKMLALERGKELSAYLKLILFFVNSSNLNQQVFADLFHIFVFFPHLIGSFKEHDVNGRKKIRLHPAVFAEFKGQVDVNRLLFKSAAYVLCLLNETEQQTFEEFDFNELNTLNSFMFGNEHAFKELDRFNFENACYIC